MPLTPLMRDVEAASVKFGAKHLFSESLLTMKLPCRVFAIVTSVLFFDSAGYDVTYT